MECLIANTVFSFVDKDPVSDDKDDKDASVSGQLENTVVSQLNLSIDILDIKNKEK